MPDTETRVEGFIAMIYHYWGWGATPKEAVAKLRTVAPRDYSVAKGKRAIYQLPAGARDAHVGEIGDIRWTWADDAPDRKVTGTYIETPKEK